MRFDLPLSWHGHVAPSGDTGKYGGNKAMVNFVKYPGSDRPPETFQADTVKMNPPWTEAVLYKGKGKDAREIGRVPLRYGQVLIPMTRGLR